MIGMVLNLTMVFNLGKNWRKDTTGDRMDFPSVIGLKQLRIKRITNFYFI